MVSIYQGDDTWTRGRQITIDIPDAEALSGFRFGFEFCGIMRRWEYAAGGSFQVDYSAEETATMPLGVSYGVLFVENDGHRTLSGTIPVLVTDCVERVHGGDNSIPVSVVVHALVPHVGKEALTRKSTDSELRELVNALLAAINSSSSPQVDIAALTRESTDREVREHVNALLSAINRTPVKK